MARRAAPPDPHNLHPEKSLGAALEHARRFYAKALAELSMRRMSAVGDEVLPWDMLYSRLAHDAIWAVTELHRGAETKYFRQRYVSEGVLNQWRGASTRGACGAGVQHEHVVEVSEIKKLLKEAQTEQEFYEALALAEACVVTVEEHRILKERAGDQSRWERYVKAKIAVWDREKAQWRVPPAADPE